MAVDMVLNALARASEGDLSVGELVSFADSLGDGRHTPQIVKLYQTWIDHNEKHPLLHIILFNYGTVLTKVGDLEGARKAFEQSIAVNADFAPAYINLGRLFENIGAVPLSMKYWTTAIDKLATITGINISHKITALNQAARVLAAGNQDEASEAMLRQSLEIDPGQREVVQHYVATRQRLCAWPVVKPIERVSYRALIEGMSPLSMAIHADDPMMQLACNAHYNNADVGSPEEGPMTSHWAAYESGKKSGAIRVGYLSSDLREHAIGFLMAELFAVHDRKKVEVYVYYCGAISKDSMMERIKMTVDHWIPISALDDAAAARRIADDGIQILVDVNGYTREGRTKLVAMRPAPVIVNWLGFPGSMGSPYHHYIIADDWIIPPEHEIFYSEKVLRLPCYQPNDRKRKVAEDAPTREDMGLPSEGVVYCCFNGTQKFSQHVFDMWMSILARVPDSVLWLLSGTEEAHKRLRDYATLRGIAPERLVFAKKMPNAKHLARYRLADLFLDTFPYGAHTTASDALWMGVPVLTFSGLSFASRVCGSLLRSAGLSEMVCTSEEEYLGRAIALGKDRGALRQYRDKLETSRDTCDLFNLPKLVLRLEELYAEMWGTCEKGALPSPDLRNMDVYMDVGCAKDFNESEVLSLTDERKKWTLKLKKRNKVRPVFPDSRYCTEAVFTTD